MGRRKLSDIAKEAEEKIKEQRLAENSEMITEEPTIIKNHTPIEENKEVFQENSFNTNEEFVDYNFIERKLKELDDAQRSVGITLIKEFSADKPVPDFDADDEIEKNNSAKIAYLNQYSAANQQSSNDAANIEKISQNFLENINSLVNTYLNQTKMINYSNMNYYSILTEIQTVDNSSLSLIELYSLLFKYKLKLDSRLNNYYIFMSNKYLDKNRIYVISSLSSEKERDNFVKNRYRGLERIKNAYEFSIKVLDTSIDIVEKTDRKLKSILERMDKITDSKLRLNLIESRFE